jgi:uncharacterized protein (TIGR02594 family)
MRLEKNRLAAMLLCSVAFVLLAVPAIARPAHRATHRHHGHHAVQAMAQPQNFGVTRDDRYPVLAAAEPAAAETATGRRHGRRTHAGDAYGGPTSDSLVSEARSYIGTNPTGRGRQWCGAFMDLVLKKTGHAGGGNLARGYARYGTRISGPQVGAIAVMNHHVGVVSGIDANGNPIVVSGNHNRTVAESVYPRGRIAAYVMPGN